MLAATFPGRADQPVPVDATDRLLLAEASDAIVAAGQGHVAIIDDRFGALTLAAATLLGDDPRVRVHQDEVTAVARLRAAAEACGLTGAYESIPRLDENLLREARVVLIVLPRSLAALREIAERIATHASPDVRVFAGGRVKHMTPAMNDVLGECFAEVSAGLARGKSRVLRATGPRPPAAFTYPASTVTDAGPVIAHGATFAAGGLDLGTRALLAAFTNAPASRAASLPDLVSEVVDLGCGTGLLAAWAAGRWPKAHIWATDQSAAAVASAALTAQAHGVGAQVSALLADVGAGIPDGGADVVLCNPPFHDRAALRTDTAHRMFAAAGRMLRPGGELWCVWNSHLQYRPALERAVGPTTQAARDRRFTITVSRRG